MRDGDVDVQYILKFDQCEDELHTSNQVREHSYGMRTDHTRDDTEFRARYPYDGTDYFTYFGELNPTESIWSITRCNARLRKRLYE